MFILVLLFALTGNSFAAKIPFADRLTITAVVDCNVLLRKNTDLFKAYRIKTVETRLLQATGDHHKIFPGNDVLPFNRNVTIPTDGFFEVALHKENSDQIFLQLNANIDALEKRLPQPWSEKYALEQTGPSTYVFTKESSLKFQEDFAGHYRNAIFQNNLRTQALTESFGLSMGVPKPAILEAPGTLELISESDELTLKLTGLKLRLDIPLDWSSNSDDSDASNPPESN